jgi:hypothetical protein
VVVVAYEPMPSVSKKLVTKPMASSIGPGATRPSWRRRFAIVNQKTRYPMVIASSAASSRVFGSIGGEFYPTNL